MNVFGTNEQRDPIFKLASPVKHITSDDPPFLIIHGEFDKTVPVYQSFMLYEKLKEAGISAQYIKVRNADHAYDSVGENPLSPSKVEIINTILLFLKNNY